MRKDQDPSQHFMALKGYCCGVCKKPWPCPTDLERRADWWAEPENQEWIKELHEIAAGNAGALDAK